MDDWGQRIREMSERSFARAQRAYERQLPPDDSCPKQDDDDCIDDCPNCKYTLEADALEEQAENAAEARAEYERERREAREGL